VGQTCLLWRNQLKKCVWANSLTPPPPPRLSKPRVAGLERAGRRGVARVVSVRIFVVVDDDGIEVAHLGRGVPGGARHDSDEVVRDLTEPSLRSSAATQPNKTR
jgi:hypothetical protein